MFHCVTFTALPHYIFYSNKPPLQLYNINLTIVMANCNESVLGLLWDSRVMSTGARDGMPHSLEFSLH
ncbi:hypothetical protein EB796_019833 [Bugula neritina]|uniref:Uncharacterized protein n=1 Tax=Bugula neritina TaxID=10212 RepID=A0A7J7J909_BUGNE|nr:hypothetical protein EB796_019833 [Bugula neritina]